MYYGDTVKKTVSKKFNRESKFINNLKHRQKISKMYWPCEIKEKNELNFKYLNKSDMYMWIKVKCNPY